MADSIEGSAEVTGLFDADATLWQRIELHHEIGRISRKLNEANQEYAACIEKIMKNEQMLYAHGIDKSEIEFILRQPAADDTYAGEIA